MMGSHHWRFCPKDNLRIISSDPIVEVGVCEDCGLRSGRIKDWVPKWLFFLAERYAMWKLFRVFGEEVDWFAADEKMPNEVRAGIAGRKKGP